LGTPERPVSDSGEGRSCSSSLLVFVGLGPILWLAKSAIMPTSDTISHPMSLFRTAPAWSNLRRAWVDVHVGRYFWNTIVRCLRLVADANRRRDDGRLRPLGVAPELRQG
jgi:hypothetical protein